MSTTALLPDPVAMVDSLEPDAIRARLADLDRQSRALRVLLRAAVARERQDLRSRPTATAQPGGNGNAA
ncbi:MAG TPA: hypothetical protein VFW33_13265 [Gemmataceae bacterium]|nr:hypothetical protein [Gemmataceae bacterium]